MSIEAIKMHLEVLGSLKVEFTPKSDEGNSIIVPINDDYDCTFFTVIGCGDKQDNLGAYMASAVNELPDLISEIDRLQRENDELRLLLVPFAEEAENWSDSVPDDHKTLCTEPGSSTAHPGSEAYFTVGDLRRARTALASTGGEHHAE